MAKGRIRVDYDNALTQAAKLEELSKQCQGQNRKMDMLIDLISETWCGKSGERMRDICRAWKNTQLGQQVRLEMEANKIRNVVESLKEAEQRTIEEINGMC